MKWFAAACLLSLPLLLAKGWRWRRLLEAWDVKLTLADSMGLYAAGMLAGAVTPGKVGGLVKIPFLVSRGVRLGSSVTASLGDRALDAFVVALLGLGSALWLPDLSAEITWTLAFLLVLMILVLVFFWIVPEEWVRRRGPSPDKNSRLAGWWEQARDEGIALRRRVRAAGARWWGAMVVSTVLAWSAYYLAIGLCAVSLGLDLTAVDLVAGVSAAAVLAVVPVTVAGVGTREAAFLLVFGRTGLTGEEIVALSSLVLAWVFVNCGVFFVASRLLLKESRTTEA
jgi:uncharacterized protein (TIRG00374 family)